MSKFKRYLFPLVLARVQERRKFIQVLAGPRQVGKTTLARQVAGALRLPVHQVSADEATLQDRVWLDQQWEVGRSLTRASGHAMPALLILDEIQKVPHWSETIKRLWDEDTLRDCPLHVLISGSSPLLVQKGLGDSLAGRFEMIRVPHWSYTEMRAAFGWTLDQYIYFGGYPGAADMIDDEPRWRRYITDALIETTISRDILLMTRVDKPALLRRLFHLVCEYSGQILSYHKMLGQLHDAGNTVTLAHYLDLLNGAGLVSGLHKYAAQRVRQRASSPKLQVLNTALISALTGVGFAAVRADPERWGRVVESAVGAHLINSATDSEIDVHYWLDCNREVDFVLSSGKKLAAIEVKSGKRVTTLPGVDRFSTAFKVTRQLLIGAQGIDLESFFSKPASHWVG